MTPAAVEALVDAAAAAIALPIAPEHRPGVLAFYGLAATMADLVEGLPIARDDESGSVFVPVPAKERR